MKKILVICTGNTCRSPVVEAVLNQRLNASSLKDWEIQSAGTNASAGSPASPFGVEALKVAEGIDIDAHRSKKVSQEMISTADLVICLAERHRESLENAFELGDRPVELLTEFVSNKSGDVVDPYGGSREDYEKMVSTVIELIDNGLNSIKQHIGD